MHELKTWPEYFREVEAGNKTFEVRKNDRDFKVGETMVLREYYPEHDTYSGRYESLEITYILQGGQFGIEPGYCVIGFTRNN